MEEKEFPSSVKDSLDKAFEDADEDGINVETIEDLQKLLDIDSKVNTENILKNKRR